MDKVANNLKAFEVLNKNIHIENGHEFLENIRKEARRQRAMKIAKDLELQAKELDQVPSIPADNLVEEVALADSFEICEED